MEAAWQLAPISLDDPSGPDLAYSAERVSIEDDFARASSGAADEVDWKETIAAIAAQCVLTRDLWLAVYLARAGARSNRLDFVEDGIEMLAGLMEGFWDTVHPKLEEYGIEGRKTPCEALVRIGEFLGPLRRVILVEHPRLGSYSGEDFERFASDGEGTDGYGQFRAAIADTPLDRLQAVIDRLDHIVSALSRADTVLSRQASLENQTGTNFEPTFEVLASLRNAVLPYVVYSHAPAERMEDVVGSRTDDTGGKRTAAEDRQAVKTIETREDVARVLDTVIDYYVRREPSSPIPVALGRIKGWIAMDFMSLMQDISPGGMSEAAGILRARVEERGGSDLM
jgi:type VI secretion system protein ImpA